MKPVAMKLVILLHHPFELWCAPAWLGPRLAQTFPQIQVVQLPCGVGDSTHLGEELCDADAAVLWRMTAEELAAARQLRWIHSTAAAVHTLIFPEMLARDIVISNGREVHAPVVAEHILALVFALAKRLPLAVQFQARREWAQQELWQQVPPPREVAGATLGLVGLGSIGRETSRRAQALGMRVVAVREHPEKGSGEGVTQVYGPAELDRLLAESDYVVLAAPSTSATHRLMNAAHLARMKPDAYLINVGRGSLLDEEALIAALRAGQIAGAALDVFDREPLPADSALWDAPNLLITPHTASVTEKMWERHYQMIAENLRRFLGGEALLWVVDKSKGY